MGEFKKCSGVLCDRKMPHVKLNIIQNSGNTRIGVGCIDMGNNEKPIKETYCE